MTHGRISTKGNKELYEWIVEAERKIRDGEIGFPTPMGEAVVYKALDRQREYHFVERNGQWYAKNPRNLKVS